MLLKYPCERCRNEIISDVNTNVTQAKGTVPAYCSQCLEENPLDGIICLTMEDLQEKFSRDNIDNHGDQ